MSQTPVNLMFRFSCARKSFNRLSFGFFSALAFISSSHSVVAKPRARQSCSPRIPKPMIPRRIGLPLIGPDGGGGDAFMFSVSSRKLFSLLALPVTLAPAYQTPPIKGRLPSPFRRSLLDHFPNMLSCLSIVVASLIELSGGFY